VTRSVANRTVWSDEQGALLVLTAILVPAIIALGALTFGVTSLWTSHEDVQRAVDLGSTVAAAATPTAAVTPGAATMPFPFDGTSVTRTLDENTPIDPTVIYNSGDWKRLPCDVALGEIASGRSAVTNAFKTADDARLCIADWQHEIPELAAIAACAGDLLDVAGCADVMRDTLAQRLPAIESTDPRVTRLMDKAIELTRTTTNTANKLLTAQTARQLPLACTKKLSVVIGLITSTSCIQTLGDLLSPLIGSGSYYGDECTEATTRRTVCVDLDGLLPAVLTPRVNVRIEGVRSRPTFSPFTFTLSSTATARRTIKSAMVLPTAAIPVDSLSSDLPGPLGRKAAALKERLGIDDLVIDPENLSIQAQSALTDVQNRTYELLEELNTAVDDSIVSSFMTAACGRAVLSRYCPEIDPAQATAGLGQGFLQDLRDATRPPPEEAQQPTLNEVLDSYIESGQPVAFVHPLRPFQMKRYVESLFGQSVWTILTDPTVNPVLAPLLSPLMYIPALDVVPATVGRIVIDEEPIYTLRSIPWSDTLATRGLYQARLVK
jgi:hypothetical protein